MSSLNRNKFRSLVRKYLSGTASTEETEAAERYYDLFSERPDATGQMDEKQFYSLEKRIKSNIDFRLHVDQTVHKPFYRSVYFRAAAILVTMVGMVAFYYLSDLSNSSRDSLATTLTGKKEGNRFVILPDGSKVVLHGNSRLVYGANFNKDTREVLLIGEAYFDIVHLTGQNSGKQVPFIIKTGKIKTTVLGTAFNVKAWPGQKEVTVTVTRGKVRVEDETQLVAVLTSDKQVVYNTNTAISEEKKVTTEGVVEWWQRDMTFEEMSFGELAVQLEKRYDVTITFKNPELKNCRMTGRFSGTETLQEVFTVLSTTSNTTYSLKDSELVIDGEKCN